jgi:hypothetical protein
MNFTYASNLDNVFGMEYKLNLSQLYLMSFIILLPTWAEKMIIGNEVYYKLTKKKVISDLPMLTDKEDTVYRIMKQLEGKGLIVIKKIDYIDHIALTKKCSTWNRGVGSEKNPSVGLEHDASEKNPNTLGKKSEHHSEKNPTDYNTKDNNCTNNQSSSGENFSELVFAEFRRQKPELPQTALVDEVNLFIKKYNGRDVQNMAALVKNWVSKVDWSKFDKKSETLQNKTKLHKLDWVECKPIMEKIYPKKTTGECYEVFMYIQRRNVEIEVQDSEAFLRDYVLKMGSPDYEDKVEMTYSNILAEVKFHTKNGSDVWHRYVSDKIFEKWGGKSVLHFEEMIMTFLNDAKNKINLFAAQ